jgi:hypothetical protein
MGRKSVENDVLRGTIRLRSKSIFLPLLGTLLFCSLLIHCKGHEPEDLTPKEEDLLVKTTALLSLAAQEYAEHPDGLTARQDSIFSSLGLERDDYHRLIEKLGQRPERWLEVWERIVKQIEASSGVPSGKPPGESPKDSSERSSEKTGLAG